MGKALSLDEQIAAINRELHQVSLRKKGDRLYLRGMFPPKHGDGSSPRRYEVATKKPATAAGLKQARAIALEVESLLIRDRFDWDDWLGTKAATQKQTIGEWVEKFERDYWSRVSESVDRLNSYHKSYTIFFRHLPRDSPLSVDVLRQVLEERSHPGTRTRISYCQAYGALATFAGLDGAVLREMGRGYNSKSINPRALPTDEDIKRAIALLPQHWQWVYGAMACYGLRNHEALIASPDRLCEDVPLLAIPENSKTGERIAFPIFPAGWDVDIREWQIPKVTRSGNAAVGAAISQRFKKSAIGFTPYALRHAYARRGFEMGFPPDFLAMSMGHSLQVHLKTYRAWWGEQPYLKVYREVMARHEHEKSDH